MGRIGKVRIPFSIDVGIDDVLDRLAVFLEPIYQNMLSETNYDKRWSCENKMWI